jgi:hypothetical protein
MVSSAGHRLVWVHRGVPRVIALVAVHKTLHWLDATSSVMVTLGRIVDAYRGIQHGFSTARGLLVRHCQRQPEEGSVLWL